MIQCPQCKNTLPDFVQACQFCGADVSKLAKASGGSGEPKTGSGVDRKWVLIAYYVVGSLWLLDAGFGIVSSIRGLTSGEGDSIKIFAIAGILVSAVHLFAAIGWLARIRLVRTIIRWILGLNLIFSLLDLIPAVISILAIGVFGLLSTLLVMLQIAVYAGMFWLMGETESDLWARDR